MKNYEELTYSDKFVFAKVNETDPELCKDTIELVSGINVEDAAFLRTENEIQITYRGKTTRLDLMLDTADHRIDFDMENRKHIQKREFPLRLRFYQDVIDLDMLTFGLDYSQLKKNVVIFLCTYDPFGKGYYRYIFKNRCVHDNELELGDETVKIVLNSKGRRSAPGDKVSDGLKNFLAYVKDGKVADEFTRRLDMKVEDVINSNDFKIEYMSAVADYMADEYEKATYRKEIDELKKTVESLRADKDSIQADKESLQADKESLQADKEVLQAKIEEMARRIAEYEAIVSSDV